MNVFTAVKDFVSKYNQATMDYNGVMADPERAESLLEFRLNLINEECRELSEEFMAQTTLEDDQGTYLVFEDIPLEEVDWQNVTKELSDIIYVVVGMAVTFNLPLEEVFRRTHMSNLSKNGGVRDDGKILKGDGYEAPNIVELFDNGKTLQ